MPKFPANMVRKKKYLAALILWVIPFSSWADSWCNFDQGFIGTQATGYIFPFSLEGYIEQPLACKVQTYAAPSGTATDILDCNKFQYTPSEYIDKANPFPNEYFTLMVFATKDLFVQLRLKENQPVWAKIRNSSVTQMGRDGVFPANQIFSKPDRLFPAPPSLTPKDATMRKKIHELIGSDKPDTADFVYVDGEELTTADGTVWLKAKERFRVDLYDNWYKKIKLPSKKFEAPSGNASYWTEPLRTVYIPVRNAHGVILNVSGNGNLFCD